MLGASPAPRLGLVLELLDTRGVWGELGGPPNFDTCTRDTYPPTATFSAAQALRTLRGLAARTAADAATAKGFARTLCQKAAADCQKGAEVLQPVKYLRRADLPTIAATAATRIFL